MATDRQIFDLIINSDGYKSENPPPLSPQDRTKVNKALAGQPSQKPASRLASAAWELAKRIAPPPPPVYKKVAPRVAHAEGGSDARFCLVNQPGVFQITSGPNAGKYSDESGAIYTNLDGLDESGIRSGAPAPTGAKEINGRPYCSLPMEGDPTKNTGSWSI